MKVENNSNTELVDKFQHLNSAMNAVNSVSDNARNIRLLDEFSKILDKIASAVSDLQESENTADLLVSEEFFAELNKVDVKASEGEVVEEDSYSQDDVSDDYIVSNIVASENNDSELSDSEEVSSQIEESESDEIVEAKDSEVDQERAEDAKVVVCYANPQHKSQVADKDKKLKEDENSDSKKVAEQNPTGQNVVVDADQEQNLEANLEQPNLSKEELLKLAGKLEGANQGKELVNKEVTGQSGVGKGLAADATSKSVLDVKTADSSVLQNPELVNNAQNTAGAVDLNIKLPEGVTTEQVIQKLIEKLADKLSELSKPELLKIEQLLQQQIQLTQAIKTELAPTGLLSNLQNNSKNTLEQQFSLAQNILKNVQANGPVVVANDKSAIAFAKNHEKTEETQRLPRGLASRSLQKVEEALKEVAKSKDGKTISVRLDPPSLGHVKIDVTLKDGVLSARLQAENPQVATLLRDHGLDLQSVLRKLGLSADDITVSVRGENNADTEFNNWMGGKDTKKQKKDEQAQEASLFSFVSQEEVKEKIEDRKIQDHWVA